MKLYMMNRQHGRMILESVKNGPLIWSSISENRVTRPKKYSELSDTKAIQADCDVKETNIILQGLPPEVYALVSNHKVAKELWERIQLLMQGSSLTQQEREDLHTTNVDQLHAYLGQPEFHANESSEYGSPYQSSQHGSHIHSSTHLSITYLPNDFQSSVYHNVYNPSPFIPQVEYAPSVIQQLNFSQPDSGLIIPVFQKGDDPIDAINHMMSFLTAVVTSLYPPTNNQLRNSSNPRQQATINNGRVTIQPIQGRHTFWLLVHNQDNVTHNVINQAVQAMPLFEQLNIVNQSETEITSDSNIILYSQYINLDNKSVNETLTAELERYTDQVRILKEGNNVDKVSDSCAQSVETDNLKQTLLKHLKEKESLKQTVTLLKNDFQKEESRNIDRELAIERQIKELNNIVFKRNQSKAEQLEPKLYDGSVIQKTNTIVIRDSKKTLMLVEESRSKMLLKPKDPMMSEKKFNIKPNYVNSKEPNLSTRPTQVEVPKELPKVSMVNTSLKKLKHHLASFDVVVKERTTATAITEGTWGFEHTKSCFRDEIPFVKALKDLFNSFDQILIDELSEVQNVFHQIEHAVEQHRVESSRFQVKMNKVLNKNERLLEQVISKDVVNIIVTATVNNAFEYVHECERCVKLETEL
nr:hypothetical protein [Tanacetum cinerariifolium]